MQGDLRARWSAVLQEGLRRPKVRPAILLVSLCVVSVVIVATTLGSAGAPTAVLPTSSHSAAPSSSSAPTPSEGPHGSPMIGRFVPAFSYTIPDGSGLTAIGGVPGAVAWVVGPNRLPADPAARGGFGGEGQDTGNNHGVLVAEINGAWGHGYGGRVALRSTPAEFLADFDRLLFGVNLGSVTATTLDGRPALMARTAPGMSSNHSDLHVDGSMTGLAGAYIVMTSPYQITVADIDGTTVLVQVWARTEEDLAAWLPVARRFVDSMHFVDR